MSNQYEGSAIAESDRGMSTPVADNAAEQQDSLPAEMSPLQLLYSVVEHNVANPDKRIKLSPEQGKEIMADFVNFVAGSSDTPTNEDGQPKTFSDMDDNELLKCLSDYLGSGVANTSINGAGIELAQDLVAEMYMSEDELAELANPKTPNGRELKEKKFLERMRDAAQEIADAQSKWDNDMHSIGGHEYSGADLHKINTYLLDPANADTIEQDLIDNEKVSPEEAKKRRIELQELAKLLEKRRNGEKLTPEEQQREQELSAGPAGQRYSRMANKVLAVEGQQYKTTVSAERTGQTASSFKESLSGGADIQSEMNNSSEVVASITPLQLSQDMNKIENKKVPAILVSSESGIDELMSPVIQASPLKPAFAKAEASTIPLDSSPSVKMNPVIMASNTKQSPQLGGLDV